MHRRCTPTRTPRGAAGFALPRPSTPRAVPKRCASGAAGALFVCTEDVQVRRHYAVQPIPRFPGISVPRAVPKRCAPRAIGALFVCTEYVHVAGHYALQSIPGFPSVSTPLQPTRANAPRAGRCAAPSTRRSPCKGSGCPTRAGSRSAAEGRSRVPGRSRRLVHCVNEIKGLTNKDGGSRLRSLRRRDHLGQRVEPRPRRLPIRRQHQDVAPRGRHRDVCRVGPGDPGRLPLLPVSRARQKKRYGV